MPGLFAAIPFPFALRSEAYASRLEGPNGRTLVLRDALLRKAPQDERFGSDETGDQNGESAQTLLAEQR